MYTFITQREGNPVCSAEFMQRIKYMNCSIFILLQYCVDGVHAMDTDKTVQFYFHKSFFKYFQLRILSV